MADDLATHPRHRVRTMVYAPLAQRRTWIESELSRVQTVVQVGRSIEHIVAALVEDPPPRAQVLIVDFDATDGADVFRLHAAREHGWCGTIIGLGRVPAALRHSLSIDRVLNTPFVRDALVDAFDGIGFTAPTTRIPVIADDELPLPRRTPPAFRARSKARVR